MLSCDHREGVGRTRKKITWRNNMKGMVDEEKDGNSDILTRFTNFVDNNLRLFRVRIKKERFYSVPLGSVKS